MRNRQNTTRLAARLVLLLVGIAMFSGCVIGPPYGGYGYHGGGEGDRHHGENR